MMRQNYLLAAEPLDEVKLIIKDEFLSSFLSPGDFSVLLKFIPWDSIICVLYWFSYTVAITTYKATIFVKFI